MYTVAPLDPLHNCTADDVSSDQGRCEFRYTIPFNFILRTSPSFFPLNQSKMIRQHWQATRAFVIGVRTVLEKKKKKVPTVYPSCIMFWNLIFYLHQRISVDRMDGASHYRGTPPRAILSGCSLSIARTNP